MLIWLPTEVSFESEIYQDLHLLLSFNQTQLLEEVHFNHFDGNCNINLGNFRPFDSLSRRIYQFEGAYSTTSIILLHKVPSEVSRTLKGTLDLYQTQYYLACRDA